MILNLTSSKKSYLEIYLTGFVNTFYISVSGDCSHIINHQIKYIRSAT